MILILGRFIVYKWLTMSTDIGYMAGSKLSTNKKKIQSDLSSAFV